MMRVDVAVLYDAHLRVHSGNRISNPSLNRFHVSSLASVFHRVRDDCCSVLLFVACVWNVIVIGRWSDVILESDTTCMSHIMWGCDVTARSITDSKYGCDVLMCVCCLREL